MTRGKDRDQSVIWRKVTGKYKEKRQALNQYLHWFCVLKGIHKQSKRTERFVSRVFLTDCSFASDLQSEFLFIERLSYFDKIIQRSSDYWGQLWSDNLFMPAFKFTGKLLLTICIWYQGSGGFNENEKRIIDYIIEWIVGQINSAKTCPSLTPTFIPSPNNITFPFVLIIVCFLVFLFFSFLFFFFFFFFFLEGGCERPRMARRQQSSKKFFNQRASLINISQPQMTHPGAIWKGSSIYIPNMKFVSLMIQTYEQDTRFWHRDKTYSTDQFIFQYIIMYVDIPILVQEKGFFLLYLYKYEFQKAY